MSKAVLRIQPLYIRFHRVSLMISLTIVDEKVKRFYKQLTRF